MDVSFHLQTEGGERKPLQRNYVAFAERLPTIADVARGAHCRGRQNDLASSGDFGNGRMKLLVSTSHFESAHRLLVARGQRHRSGQGEPHATAGTERGNNLRTQGTLRKTIVVAKHSTAYSGAYLELVRRMHIVAQTFVGGDDEGQMKFSGKTALRVAKPSPRCSMLDSCTR